MRLDARGLYHRSGITPCPEGYLCCDIIISLPLDVLGEVEGLGAGDVTDDDAAANRGGDEFVLIFVCMFFLPADGEQVGIDLAVDEKAEIFFAFFDDRF